MDYQTVWGALALATSSTFTYTVAHSGGLTNLAGWFVVGLLFGPLAPIAVGFAEPSEAGRERYHRRNNK